MLIPATKVIGGTTSGSVQITSITGPSLGALSRTASIAGSMRPSTSTIVATASASESSRLVPKPSALKISR